MFDPRRSRLAARPLMIAAPPLFVERRVGSRRVEDRKAHEERALLARALDILAGGADAEARLAGILNLLADTVGARRAAVLANGAERHSAVAVAQGEDASAANDLAAWLDARSDRSRAERAASGRARVSVVVADARADPPDEPEAITDRASRSYALLPIPSAGDVVLGFEFADPPRPGELARRLPPQLARHAAVALALVTEQLATERELASLRAKDAEQTRFVSTVAHELRTPLTGLRGYLELILGDRVDDPAVEREFLERSRAIVGSMDELVGDLLQLSRLESGGLDLELEPFSLAEAISQVADGLLPIAIEREVGLRTTLPPRLGAATGDRRRVEQILTNLVNNALKFSPVGGCVELEGRFEGAVALVIVRDDGAGIEADDRARIFERFQRLPGHERIIGTGLGLPIALGLARELGGDLDVASVPGSGSAFVLVLPGPAITDAEVIEATLARTLAAEEAGLEERAVLRAIGGRSRSATALDGDATEPGLRLVDGNRPSGPTRPASEVRRGKATRA
ncbi:MAG TPA: GAF domain-containing sensor histidine kinase [Candidatus Dormibacteraeota bacterium]|nr:GAF domain-containing sensor histidine kinase [Candidatus Dormibacteraeota bacterium]